MIACFICAYMVPIVVGVSFNLGYWYWISSGILLASSIVLLWTGGLIKRTLALLINSGTTLGNFALAASLYTQGVGFNE